MTKKATPQSAVMPDCQSEVDHRQLPINKVGIKGLRYPIAVQDKKRKSLQHTVATVELAVDLPAQFKGTHMSRFVEILQSQGPEFHVGKMPVVLKALQEKLHAKVAHLTMTFPYFIEKRAPVTKARGLVDYNVTFDGKISGKDYDLVVKIEVPVTTLCPCSKAISAQGAHNQRGYVTLSVRFQKTVWIEDLVTLIEASASAPIYSLLKRPDEKFVTEQAYDNPVFVEDLVRNVAQRCNQHRDITWYRVEAENMESIHNHAAYACIEKS
jgi:GTP cyclohydrolase IB